MNDESSRKPRAARAVGNLQKDPGDWVTGDEQMTMAQARI